jgi:CO/xanthine dehydrogenase Mo-binding subunit
VVKEVRAPAGRVLGQDALLFTGADVARMVRPMRVEENGLRACDRFPLAIERALFVGDPVAVVLAPDRYQAEDLADAVLADYEPLPAVAVAREGLEDKIVLRPELGTNTVYEHDHRYGEAEEAVAAAPVQVRHAFRYPRQDPTPLECRGVVAHVDERPSLNVFTSTQVPHLVRTYV